MEAFPDGFRLIAGDPFLRNFTWPIPDPPKSEWTGDQASQAALAQKALGFNCLNYNKKAEPSLGRHFLPDKAYLDEHCTDGVRFEVMFPSCWNGKDVDSDDHKSHMAYPSLVMDGTCPEGFETRLVSLFFETIWNTYAFKDRDGYFALSTGDPTGFGYHGDFMHGWESGVLEEAVKTCTNPSGQVSDCPVFDLQSDTEQTACSFDLPSLLFSEDVTHVKGHLPNKVAMEWGPEYAFPVKYVGDSGSGSGSGSSSSSSSATSSSTGGGISLSVGLDGIGGNVFAADEKTGADSEAKTTEPSSTSSPTNVASSSTTSSTTQAPTTTSSISTSTWTPTPTTSWVQNTVTQETVWVEQEIAVMVDEEGKPLRTSTGDVDLLSTDFNTVTRTVSSVVQVPTQPAKRHHDHFAAHKRHQHGHAH